MQGRKIFRPRLGGSIGGGGCDHPYQGTGNRKSREVAGMRARYRIASVRRYGCGLLCRWLSGAEIDNGAKVSAFFFGFLEPESIGYRCTEIPGKPEKVFGGLCAFLFLFGGRVGVQNSPPLEGCPKGGVVGWVASARRYWPPYGLLRRFAPRNDGVGELVGTFTGGCNHPVRLRRPPLRGRGIGGALSPGPSPASGRGVVV
jgi:hypothetical protein